MPAVARRIALSALNALDGSDVTPDDVLSEAFEEDRPPRRDPALETILAEMRAFHPPLFSVREG